MCKTSMLLFFVLLFSNGIAQDYHVLQVKGSVKDSKGSQIRTNDVLRPNDKLSFSSPTDAVAVVSEKSGRFIIKAAASESKSELVAYVKNAITPGVKKLSTRSGVINNVIDFQTYFQSEVVLLNSIMLQTNLSNFPVTEESFFFIRYKHNNEEINKKLVYRGDSLVINRRELFMVDNNVIDPSGAKNLELYYLRDHKIQLLTPVHFVLPNLTQLTREIQLLWSKQKFESEEQKTEEASAYINEFYGKIDLPNVVSWSRQL